MCRQRTTTSLFKLPCTRENAVTILRSALEAEVAARGGTPVFRDETVSAVNRIAEILTSDSRKFGLMLCGKCGNGKTTVAKAVAGAVRFMAISGHLEPPSLRMEAYDAKSIASAEPDSLNHIKRLCLLDIEDLGEEPTEKVTYGNISNPLVDVLEYRYNCRLFTVATTNLTPPQITAKYGQRIADRAREMFEAIVFNGNSFRH